MADLTLDRLDTVARCLLIALARRERVGRAPQRLLEPGLATWEQLRGNLGLQHLLQLLAEDAAVRFPLPADLRRVFGAPVDFGRIPNPTVYSWLKTLPTVLDLSRTDAIADYAKALGLQSRIPDPKRAIQADKRVLELPGTGGQIVARALTDSAAHIHTNATVLTSSWADRAMAGLVAMELDAPGVDFVQEDPQLAWATEPEQRNRFDLVFGLSPEKGGAWDRGALEGRFPAATVVLV